MHCNTGRITQDYTGRITQDYTGRITLAGLHRITQDYTGRITQDYTGRITQDYTGRITQDYTGRITQDYTGRITELTQENTRVTTTHDCMVTRSLTSAREPWLNDISFCTHSQTASVQPTFFSVVTPAGWSNSSPAWS